MMVILTSQIRFMVYENDPEVFIFPFVYFKLLEMSSKIIDVTLVNCRKAQ